MRIGFLSSVGGLKPVTVLGLAKASGEAGIWDSVVGFAGASGGAPWCTLLASGMPVDKVIKIALSVSRSDYWSASFLDNLGFLSRLGWMSLLRRSFGNTIAETGVDNGNAMESWLDRNLPVKTFEELAYPLAIPATIINLSRVHVFTTGPLIPAIRATTAIPVAYKPATVTIDGLACKAVDGGVARPLPVRELQDVAPDLDVIFGVVACNLSRETYVRSRSIDVGTYLDLLLDTLVYDHLQTTLTLSASYTPIVLFPVRVGASMADPENTIPLAIQSGYEQGTSFFESSLWAYLSSEPSAYKGKVLIWD